VQGRPLHVGTELLELCLVPDHVGVVDPHGPDDVQPGAPLPETAEGRDSPIEALGGLHEADGEEDELVRVDAQ
jgi:hypothetical protein